MHSLSFLAASRECRGRGHCFSAVAMVCLPFARPVLRFSVVFNSNLQSLEQGVVHDTRNITVPTRALTLR